MSDLDLIALGGAVALAAAFLLAKAGEGLFIVPGAAVVVVAAAYAVRSQRPFEETALLVLGLLFWFIGLAIVRIMLHRSVSLRILARISAGGVPEESRAEIGARLGDIERYGLARRNGDCFALTAFGSVVARVVGVMYRATRVDG